jgi:hypothetical protein
MHGNAANRASLPKTLPLRACVTPGANSVPTLNAPQPVLYYFPPDDIASRVSVDRLLNVLTVGLVKVEFVRAEALAEGVKVIRACRLKPLLRV